MTESFTCRICGNSEGNLSYTMTEGLFGTWEEFEYYRCKECGCLQIKEYPKDMASYYPKEYLSFKKRQGKKQFFLKTIFQSLRTNAYLSGRGLIGKLLLKFGKISKYLDWAKKTGCNIDSKVLDVGCGTGKLLIQFSNMGFRNLLGVDLFIEKDHRYDCGVRLVKKDIFDVEGEYDLIVMSHTLEHMMDQEKIVSKAYDLLSDRGCLFIRIPICGTYAWEKYGTDWYCAEPPRHFYLHSVDSLKFLAEKCSFEVRRVEYESQIMQFYASEQHKMGVALMDKNSYWVDKNTDLFTKEQIEEFKLKTKELNENEDGDFAIFYLFKKD